MLNIGVKKPFLSVENTALPGGKPRIKNDRLRILEIIMSILGNQGEQVVQVCTYFDWSTKKINLRQKLKYN